MAPPLRGVPVIRSGVIEVIGILAYGSLRTDPGCELAASIVDRQSVETPFPVEFARYSSTRGGAPTLVPVKSGACVNAEILTLDQAILIEDAGSMLWRRENRLEGSGKAYVRPKKPGCNDILIERLEDFGGVSIVLYTDFPAAGKLDYPNPRDLAEAAIKSVGQALPGQDAISYLVNARALGLETQLTRRYEEEILRLTGSSTLQEALEFARQGNVRPVNRRGHG